MPNSGPLNGLSFRSTNVFVLPLLISASLCAPSAHAAEWVSTRTGAFIVPNTAGSAASGIARSLMASAVATSGYKLKRAGEPALVNTRVMPLEISQPVHVAVVLKTHNAADLDKLVADVSQPGSANYRKFITPEEFKRRFAPTDAEAAAVVAHLKSSGFSNVRVAPGNRAVTAVGNADTVRTAFHAGLKRFRYDGRNVYANDAAASVPASLGSIVDSVLGLQNAVVPKPLSHRLTDSAVAGAADSTRSDSPSTVVVHDVTDYAKIYGASRLPAATGTTVGIVTWGDVSQTIADLKTFTTQAGLPPVDTLVVPGDTGTLADDGNPTEWNLDSQTIVATAGGVKQLIFYSAINGDSNDSELTEGSLIMAMNKAITDNVAKIVNVSLSIDETAENAAGVQGRNRSVVPAGGRARADFLGSVRRFGRLSSVGFSGRHAGHGRHVRRHDRDDDDRFDPAQCGVAREFSLRGGRRRHVARDDRCHEVGGRNRMERRLVLRRS